MKKITSALLALGLSVGSFAVLAETKPNSTDQAFKRGLCQDDKCTGQNEASVSNKDIKGNSTDSKAAAHDNQQCLNGKCPGKMEADVSNKQVKGKNKATTAQKHQHDLETNDKLPGKTEEEVGKK